MLERLSAIARGKVQGVGFRATAKRLADGLGLSGSVRNLPEGTVEIHAQGEKGQLDQFLSELQGEFPQGEIEVVRSSGSLESSEGGPVGVSAQRGLGFRIL